MLSVSIFIIAIIGLAIIQQMINGMQTEVDQLDIKLERLEEASRIPAVKNPYS